MLIAIEGIDGAGKTTQARAVALAFQQRRIPVLVTKEPTDGPWGQILRHSASGGRLPLAEELATFIKDRREHVEKVIKPALESGQIVICDRYYFSTVAYQGARGGDPQAILAANEEFAPAPDLLVLIDISPETGIERVGSRGDQANLFETNGNLTRSREIFLSMQKPYLVRIDGTRSREEITTNIVRAFSRVAAEVIAQTQASPEAKLNWTLSLFGAEPISA